MTHQNLCLGKYWKLFWVTLIARRASQFIATSLRAAVFPRNVIEMNLSTYLDWKITWTENLLYSNVLADWHSKKNISFEVGKILWNWFYYKRIRKQKKQKEGEKQNIPLTFCAFQSVGKWWTGLFHCKNRRLCYRQSLTTLQLAWKLILSQEERKILGP